MKYYFKNFQETFQKLSRNFRSYMGSLTISERWLDWLGTIVVIAITVAITATVTHSITVNELKEQQKDALMDFMVDDMVDCQEDVLEQGGQCIYEITYDGDVITNIEVVRHTF